MPDSLAPFFSPRGIAVIGASTNPVKLGYGLARNLVQCNYRGEVHYINPKGGTLFNRTIVENIKEVPDPLDLAIVLIPARAIPDVLRECGERGVKAVIIASGGFRETGSAGAKLERKCLDIANDYGMRLMGPNCIGILDTHLPLDATFLPPPGPPPGDVAFISHSGAICAAVIDWARGQGFGLSRLVSLGNQVDVSEADVLAPIAADQYTQVLTLYLEGVSDGRRFVKEARQVTRTKPIVALKVGRFESGQKAVASHTGALAGYENAYNAAFRSAGVIRAETSEEVFDWARALAWCPLPEGRTMAVLTNAGGPGVTAADALEANGLSLSSLNADTVMSLQDILPPAASLGNPVDMLASATPRQYADSLEILLKDEEVHGVLVILPPPPMHTAGAVARALIPVIHNANKPIVVALMGERLIQEAVEHFRAARVPEYRFPERAASALGILTKRADFLEQAQEASYHEKEVDKEAARVVISKILNSTAPAIGKVQLPMPSAGEILSAYGIDTIPMELAVSAEEAVEHAQKIGVGDGSAVVLKVASPDIAHKTDVGGVLLNLEDKESVAWGYKNIIQQAKAAYPQAEITGVYVQPMIPAGQEVIIGTVQDPQFGAMVMFGAGGIEVEQVKDVAFSLAPLTNQEAERLLESTLAGRKLKRYRNQPAADRSAVMEALISLAQLAVDFPQLVEIEINPLRVFPKGEGVIAVDVRGSLGIKSD